MAKQLRLRLKQFEFPGLPTRHSQPRAKEAYAKDAFALMHSVAENIIDSDLARRIMAHPRRQLLIDFDAVPKWNSQIKTVHAPN